MRNIIALVVIITGLKSIKKNKEAEYSASL